MTVLPPFNVDIIDTTGRPTKYFYDFMNDIKNSLGSDQLPEVPFDMPIILDEKPTTYFSQWLQNLYALLGDTTIGNPTILFDLVNGTMASYEFAFFLNQVYEVL